MQLLSLVNIFFVCEKRDSQTTCFLTSLGKQHSRQRHGPREKCGAPLLSWEMKEAEGCRISKVDTSPTLTSFKSPAALMQPIRNYNFVQFRRIGDYCRN